MLPNVWEQLREQWIIFTCDENRIKHFIEEHKKIKVFQLRWYLTDSEFNKVCKRFVKDLSKNVEFINNKE